MRKFPAIALPDLVQLCHEALGEPEWMDHRTQELFVALRELGWKGKLRCYTITAHLPRQAPDRAMNTVQWHMLDQDGCLMDGGGVSIDQLISRHQIDAMKVVREEWCPETRLQAWGRWVPATRAREGVNMEEVARITPILRSIVQSLHLDTSTPPAPSRRSSLRL